MRMQCILYTLVSTLSSTIPNESDVNKDYINVSYKYTHMTKFSIKCTHSIVLFRWIFSYFI